MKNDMINGIKRLLKRGFKADETSERSRTLEEGFTALYFAAGAGHVEVIFDDERLTVNIACALSSPPIYFLRSASLIADCWVDVDKSNGASEATPLFLASQEGKMEVVKYFVEVGKADVDKARNDGATPLIIVKSPYHGNEEIVKYLKGKGAKEGVPRAARVPDPAPSRCARSS